MPRNVDTPSDERDAFTTEQRALPRELRRKLAVRVHDPVARYVDCGAVT